MVQTVFGVGEKPVSVTVAQFEIFTCSFVCRPSRGVVCVFFYCTDKVSRTKQSQGFFYFKLQVGAKHLLA